MKGDLEKSDIDLFKSTENIQINEETKKYFENKDLLDISMIREESVDSILKKSKETEKLDLKDDEISEKSENQEILINDYSKMDVQVGEINKADQDLDKQRAKEEKKILSDEFIKYYLKDFQNFIASYQGLTKDKKKDSVSYQRLIDSLSNVRTNLNLKDPDFNKLIDSALYLSEAANAYYDTHRGHRGTEEGRARKDMAKKIRDYMLDFFIGMSMGLGDTGDPEPDIKVPDDAEKKRVNKSIKDFDKAYKNWCTNFAKDEIIDERIHVREKFSLFKAYEEDIQKYKAIHSETKEEDMPYVIRQYDMLSEQCHFLDLLEEKKGKRVLKDKNNKEMLSLDEEIEKYAEDQGDEEKEEKISFTGKNEGLSDKTVKALEEVDKWFVRNSYNGGFMGNIADRFKNNNSEIVKLLLAKTKRERLYIYYLLETDHRKDPSLVDVHDAMDNYVPKLDLIKSTILATPLKFYSRFAGDYVYMHKLSDALRANKNNKQMLIRFSELNAETEKDKKKKEALLEAKENDQALTPQEKLDVAAIERDLSLKDAYRVMKKLRNKQTELEVTDNTDKKHEIQEEIDRLTRDAKESLRDLIEKDKQVGEVRKALGLDKGKVGDKNAPLDVKEKNDNSQVQQFSGEFDSFAGAQQTLSTISTAASTLSKVSWGLDEAASKELSSILGTDVGISFAVASNLLSFFASAYALSFAANMHAGDIMKTIISLGQSLTSAVSKLWTTAEKAEFVATHGSNATYVASEALQATGIAAAGATIAIGAYTCISAGLDSHNAENAKKLLKSKYTNRLRSKQEILDDKSLSKDQRDAELKKSKEARYEKNMIRLSEKLSERKALSGEVTMVSGTMALIGVLIPGVGTVMSLAGLGLILAHKLTDRSIMRSIREETFDEFFNFQEFYDKVKSRMDNAGKTIYDPDNFKDMLRRRLAAAAGYADLVSAQMGIATKYAELIYEKLFPSDKPADGDEQNEGDLHVEIDKQDKKVNKAKEDEKEAYIQIVKSFGLSYNEKKKKPAKKLLVRKMCGR